jgi:hypothetical protein
MKTKIAEILIVVLLLGSATVSGLNSGLDKKIDGLYEHRGIKTVVQSFSPPEIIDDGECVKIEMEEANSHMMIAGKPILPFFSTTFTFPLGTNITGVTCSFSEAKVKELDKKVKTAPEPKIDAKKKLMEDEEIYGSENPYPTEWYSYRMGGGLDEKGKHVTICSIHIYPIRYYPLKNKLEYVDEVKIEITYEKTKNIKKFDDEHEFVILAPSEYAKALEKLVQHKENHGLSTKLVTLEEIYGSEYFEVKGRDEQEKIKYFIKDTVESWNTSYVLLVGSIDKLPIRKACLYDKSEENWLGIPVPTDLYYADIYFANKSFCSWDSNDNGYFGDFGWPGRTDDVLDLYPDVYIGRLACKNIIEVITVVDKIIHYEENAYGKWFKKIICCGGDTHPNSAKGINEGEYAIEEMLRHMPDFDPIKLYGSKHNLNSLTEHLALSMGSGFAYFIGHGNMITWATHPPKSDEWIGRYYTYYMPFLINGYRLPVIMVGGCITAALDYNGTCFCWQLVKKICGGSIATIGSTRLSASYDDEHVVEGLAGYLEVGFFREYEEGKTPAEMLVGAQNDYINNIELDKQDYKTIEEYILLGDPSLRIGGYR